MATEGVLRRMLPDDVPAVMEVQEPASVAGLSGVFPQDVHPCPRRVLAERWLQEIDDPALECLVIERVETGARSRGPMPPHAELLTYAYDPEPSGTGPTVAT